VPEFEVAEAFFPCRDEAQALMTEFFSEALAVREWGEKLVAHPTPPRPEYLAYTYRHANFSKVIVSPWPIARQAQVVLPSKCFTAQEKVDIQGSARRERVIARRYRA
jgi:hypothetical protein